MRLGVGPENILVTTGGQEALFLLIQALLDPGDEILVPDPRYTSYDQAIQMAGGKIVLVPTTEADAFDLDARCGAGTNYAAHQSDFDCHARKSDRRHRDT